MCRQVYKTLLSAEATSVANFTNEACKTGGVKPSDPLFFTCEVNGVILLRVILPTGDQETISVGDTAADVALPPGFTAESLNITEVDASKRNFTLTLSVDRASRLGGGEIICDDTTLENEAKAGCLIGKHSLFRLIVAAVICIVVSNYMSPDAPPS